MSSPDSSWLAVVPPLFAIGTALATKRVVPALLAGVALGSLLLHGLGAGILRLFDTYLLGALFDSSHGWILALALALGGMIRVISHSGLALGMARGFGGFARTRRSGQLTAWTLGLLFFFDDYVNTLFVGSSIGAVSDRLRISREKLAFIVDATAAPVASLAPISSWIAVEIGYIADQCRHLEIEADAFVLFLRTLPLRFYPVLMLAFGLLIAVSNRDLGPMLRAEQKAQRAPAPADPRADAGAATERVGPSALVSWLPILSVLSLVLVGIYYTGHTNAVAAGLPPTLDNVLGNAQSSKSMVIAAAVGALVAVVLASREPGRNLRGAFGIMLRGSSGMGEVMAILLFAWALGDVCKALGTADYLVHTIGQGFDPGLLPAVVFLVSAVTSFATGTSWGTMGILFPLAMPLAHRMAPGNEDVLLGTIASILAGSVFGDHCSPISDTTIMSAMAASCDQLAHVRTQLPYALIVGAVGLGVGSVPVGLGLYPGWLGLAIGVGTLALVLRLFAGRVQAEPS